MVDDRQPPIDDAIAGARHGVVMLVSQCGVTPDVACHEVKQLGCCSTCSYTEYRVRAREGALFGVVP